MKFLGIDYGESKVGLAIGEDETYLAFPLRILKNTGWTELFEDLADVIKAENIEVIVIGLPINTIGGASQQTEKVKKFAEAIKEKFMMEVVMQDEKFSSQEAQKLGAGSREFRGDRRDDDVAAMIMLQSYLDSIKE